MAQVSMENSLGFYSINQICEADSLRKNGVYIITNIETGDFYIGSATRKFISRWRTHITALRRGNHHSKRMQNSFNAHGESAFVFKILEITSVEQALVREQFYLNQLEPPYNTCKIAGNSRGYKHSKETLERLRAIKHSEESKAKMIAAHKGKTSEAKSISKLGNTYRKGTGKNYSFNKFSDRYVVQVRRKGKKTYCSSHRTEQEAVDKVKELRKSGII